MHSIPSVRTAYAWREWWSPSTPVPVPPIIICIDNWFRFDIVLYTLVSSEMNQRIIYAYMHVRNRAIHWLALASLARHKLEPSCDAWYIEKRIQKMKNKLCMNLLPFSSSSFSSVSRSSHVTIQQPAVSAYRRTVCSMHFTFVRMLYCLLCDVVQYLMAFDFRGIVAIFTCTYAISIARDTNSFRLSDVHARAHTQCEYNEWRWNGENAHDKIEMCHYNINFAIFFISIVIKTGKSSIYLQFIHICCCFFAHFRTKRTYFCSSSCRLLCLDNHKIDFIQIA